MSSVRSLEQLLGITDLSSWSNFPSSLNNVQLTSLFCLESLNGMETLRSVNQISIMGCPELRDIDALQHLVHVQNSFELSGVRITRSTCCSSSLCQSADTAGEFAATVPHGNKFHSTAAMGRVLGALLCVLCLNALLRSMARTFASTRCSQLPATPATGTR